jgi:hypothetical protein
MKTLYELERTPWPKLLDEIPDDPANGNNFAKQAAGIIDSYDESSDYNLLHEHQIALIIQQAINETIEHLISDGHIRYTEGNEPT